jgi:predicted AlkP superfamily pyrophosphatase or phosphodiesterase
MPNLYNLLGGKRMLLDELVVTERATLLPLDACLGVPGLPQSASGQAVLLTGQNVPGLLGYHYGPKPNLAVMEFLHNGNLFKTLIDRGRTAALLNAYPPRYFSAIESGRRIYSAIPLAVTSAGIALKTAAELQRGEAISADLTAEGWHTNLGLEDTPRLSPYQAGARLASLARKYDFSLFEYWLSDYAGHGQDLQKACALLETFDQAIGGLLAGWDDQQGLILLTSDHGNLEDLSTRRHTTNPVPGLLVGAPELRERFIAFAKASAVRRGSPSTSKLADAEDFTVIQFALTDIAPAILGFLKV